MFLASLRRGAQPASDDPGAVSTQACQFCLSFVAAGSFIGAS